MLRRGLLMLGLAAALAACGLVDVRFDEAMVEQARAQLEPGQATIKGSAFLRKAKGGFATAGGEWIYLIPVTPYAEARFQSLYGDFKQRVIIESAFTLMGNPRYHDLTRKMKAKKDGNFRFEKVKPGRWFVATSIDWRDKEDDLFSLRGGMIYEEVEVKAGDEEVEVIVSGK